MSVVAGGRGGRVPAARVQPRQKSRQNSRQQERRRQNAAEVVRDRARTSVTDFYTNLQGGNRLTELWRWLLGVSLEWG